MGEGDSATADLHRVLAPLPMRGGRAGSATVLQSVRSALRALGAYRMHSVLTMLGIAFGVAALLFMVELNQVSQEYVSAQWAHIGANLVSVFYRPAPGASKALALTQSTLTLGDVQA
ncbi:MAG TPA: ABC transporter permease, partial [Chloroflexota bacterium]